MAEEPKIQIDSDWKAQAQAEKQKLREAEQKSQDAAGGAGGPGAGEMPPANFDTLIQTFATNALLAMGAVPDPQTGQRYAHMGLARHHIDMLGVLEDKTRGNLDKDEAEMLAGTLHELRQAYVQLVEHARQAATNPTPGGPAADPGQARGPAGPGMGSGPGVILPG